MKHDRIALILLFLMVILPTMSYGQVKLEGELTTGLSLASSDCKVVKGSIVCSDEPNGNDFIPYFFEELMDLKLTGLFGSGDEIRSVSEFYHPYTPFSGLTFQGFTAETLVGEIASVSGEVIFAPNITLYTFSDKRTDSFGGNFHGLAFRRYKSNVEFGLVGLVADTTLILDNWQDKPDEKPEIKPGLIFKIAGEMENEVEIEMEARLGVKGGVTCFGNCLGPLKLQKNAIQSNTGFEELLISANNFSLGDVELDLSSKFSIDNGFNSLTLSGSRTWDYRGTEIKLASSLLITTDTFMPFRGLSVVWTADPIILSFYFDETYQLENASQQVQFNPEFNDLNIEGFNFSGQALLADQISLNLTIPTDPVDLTAAFRFIYENGRYNFNSSLFRAQLPGSPFSIEGIFAFRGESRIVKLESKLEF